MNFYALHDLYFTYESKIKDLLNVDLPPLQQELILEPNFPNDLTEITPNSEDYHIAVKNFLNNENSTIPAGHRLLIKNIWFYYNKNAHKRLSIYAYCAGFETENQKRKYPLLTAPFQINTHKECQKHNQKYNNKYFTQVTLNNNVRGEECLKKNKFTFSAYHADNFVDALRQIIYVLNNLYRLIKEYNKIEIASINQVSIGEFEMKKRTLQEKKVKTMLKKKFLRIFMSFKTYQESKDATIKLKFDITL